MSAPKFNTSLTRLLDVDLPIILPPMAFASTPALASEVIKAGGFAFLGAGFDSSSKLKSDLAEVNHSLGLPSNSPIPVGVGFLGWILDQTEESEDPRIPAVLEQRPKAILFAAGKDLGKYITQVREFDAKRDHKTIIFATVNSVEAAVKAASEWRVDVIKVQGIESGGHGSGYAPSLMNLLTAIREAIPDGPPLLAAGGVSNGAQIAALLTLGASAVAPGTRFLATEESAYTAKQKAVLIESDINSTIRTHAFDEVFKTNFWPDGINGRAIKNKIIDDVNEGLSLAERQARYDAGAANAESSRLIIWAGIGVGSIEKVETTKAVCDRLRQELVDALATAGELAQ